MSYWDPIGNEYVDEGATRWEVEWEVFVSEEAASQAQECLEDWHYRTECADYPDRRAAVRAAKRVADPLLVWRPRIRKHVAVPYGSLISWEGIGEWEDVKETDA